jgi:hypothetical protein
MQCIQFTARVVRIAAGLWIAATTLDHGTGDDMTILVIV